jgi:hypothetical protein
VPEPPGPEISQVQQLRTSRLDDQGSVAFVPWSGLIKSRRDSDGTRVALICVIQGQFDIAALIVLVILTGLPMERSARMTSFGYADHCGKRRPQWEETTNRIQACGRAKEPKQRRPPGRLLLCVTQVQRKFRSLETTHIYDLILLGMRYCSLYEYKG